MLQEPPTERRGVEVKSFHEDLSFMASREGTPVPVRPSPRLSPKRIMPTPSKIECNANPFSHVRGTQAEMLMTEIHYLKLEHNDTEEQGRTPRQALPHALVAIHNQSVPNAATPFCTPTSQQCGRYPHTSDCTPRTLINALSLTRGPADDDERPLFDLDGGDSPPIRRLDASKLEETLEVDRDDRSRFSFLHVDPVANTLSYVPLHLDVNGPVWLARHRVDGLPYAVKEAREGSVENELQCLTIGNDAHSLNALKAVDHIARYHTVFRHEASSTIVLQCEYFPRGNVAEQMEFHWGLATQQLRGREISQSTLRWVVSESLMDQVELLTLIQHVLLALSAVHEKGFVHGNPILWNCFIVTNYHYKLGNFGCSARVSGGGLYPSNGHTTHHPSPELAHHLDAFQTDVYVFASSVVEKIMSRVYDIRDWFTGTSGPREATVRCFEKHFNELYQAGFHSYDSNVTTILHKMLLGVNIQEILSDLETPQTSIFHLQCVYDRELMFVVAAIDQLKQRRLSLGRKSKRGQEAAQNNLVRQDSSEPIVKTRKVDVGFHFLSSAESTPQSSPNLKPSIVRSVGVPALVLSSPKGAHESGLPFAPSKSQPALSVVAAKFAGPRTKTIVTHPQALRRLNESLDESDNVSNTSSTILHHDLDEGKVKRTSFFQLYNSEDDNCFLKSVTTRFMKNVFSHVAIPTRPLSSYE